MNLPDTTSPLGRALRIPLRLIPKDAIIAILRGPLHGKKWIVGSFLHGCWLGTYRYQKQAAFRSSVKPGNVVYDLGANVGFFSLLASTLVGEEGRVIAFEPVPRNLFYLRKHLELNRVTNCSVLEYAVGDIDKSARFHFGLGSGKGFLTEERSGGITVRVVTLDKLFLSGEIPAPDVIKCDIVCGEYAALLGTLEVLQTCRPILFLATHGEEVHQKCCNLLRNIGYRLQSLDDRAVMGSTGNRIELLAEPLAVASKAHAASEEG
jgi:FkbM family methyltransferase